MSILLKQRAEIVARSQAIINDAKAAGRSLTSAERTTLDTGLAEIDRIDADLKREADDNERMAAVGRLFGSSENPSTPMGGNYLAPEAKQGYLSVDFKARAGAIAAKAGPSGVKALMTDGSSLVPVVQVAETPVVMNKPATTLFDLIPSRVVAPDYSYLRQSKRENNAAPVARGEVKPTSKYGLERVEDRLRVIAHLSDALYVYDLKDYGNLAQFINAELRYGLFAALEHQVVSGDGTGENLRGLANTSGLVVQPFKTNSVLTIRSAITSLEAQGFMPDGILMNPVDWEGVETSTYLLNEQTSTPVDRAARRLWGLPVALSLEIEQGTSYVKSQGSLEIHVDDPVAALEWGVTGDDFTRNQVRARLEGRFNVAALIPSAIVKADLSA